jgi:SAM-dependent methyltransferase
MGLQNKLTKSHDTQNTSALTDSKFWDEYWSPNSFEGDWEAQLWSRVLQHQFHNCVKPLIDKNGFKTFLDVGIGDGILSLYFSKVLGLQGLGIDTSEVALRKSQELIKEVNADVAVKHCDLVDVQGEFDVVYAGGFIEHFENYQSIVKTMVKHVSPGGILINFFPYMSPIHSLICKFAAPDTLKTHRPISRKSIIDCYENCGLDGVLFNYAGLSDLGDSPHSENNLIWKAWDNLRVPLRWCFQRLARRNLYFNIPWVSPFLIAIGKKTDDPELYEFDS